MYNYSMSLKLTEQMRDAIVKIIAESNLPTNQGIGIINALNNLEKIEEKVEEASKETKTKQHA